MASSSATKWLKGCGIGCAVLIVLAILGTLGGSFFILRPFKSAIKTREVLDEKYGGQADYRPVADGAVSAERMKAFLVVRAALMEHCPRFAEADQGMERLDELEEDASKTEVFGEFFKLTKTMMGMGSVMGEFFATRNSALLEAGMGRGEYTYIYMVAYHDDLIAILESGEGAVFGDGPNARVRQAMMQVLRNQQAALSAAGNGLEVSERERIQAALAAEISKLEADGDRLLWQDGLPVAVAASLEPYRDRLGELFCLQTLALEFSRNKTRILGVQGD